MLFRNILVFCVIVAFSQFTAAEEQSEQRAMAVTRNRKKVSAARRRFVQSLNVQQNSTQQMAQSKNTEEELYRNPVVKKLEEIKEFLRTDGDPGTKPSGGISWLALAITFYLLSPILIPLLLSPVVVILGFFLFLPLIIDNNGAGP